MKAVGYARVSSQEQVNGTSLQSQEEQIRHYAAMKGIHLAAILVDAGVSGGKPLADRPEGRKLVIMLAQGEAQAVVMTKLDRGFRSASDCLNNVERWEKKGVALHILNLGGQTIDTSTPTGKFFITVMAGAAELERNLIKERCNEGRKARKAEGKRIGQIPLRHRLGDDGKSLVVNPEEQEAIDTCRSLAAAGMSIRGIAAEMNRRAVKSRGEKWNSTTVHRILRKAA